MNRSILVFLLLLNTLASAVARADSVEWCADSVTFCSAESAKKDFFPGFRLLYDLHVGVPIQFSDKNRIESTAIPTIQKIGIETKLFQWVNTHWGTQFGLMLPTSINFDKDSEIVKQGFTTTNKVNVKYGYFVGATVLADTIAIGYAHLKIDPYYLAKPYSGNLDQDFVYVAFQPLDMVRALKTKLKN